MLIGCTDGSMFCIGADDNVVDGVVADADMVIGDGVICACVCTCGADTPLADNVSLGDAARISGATKSTVGTAALENADAVEAAIGAGF